MHQRLLLLAAALPAVLTAGCSGTRNRGVESVHQPIVSRTDYVFDVAAGPGGVLPGDRIRLRGWLDGLKLGYGDRVAIDDPGYAGNRAARRDVADETSRHGVLLSDDVPVTGAPVAPGMVRVVVTRTKASVPGCPDYSRVTGIEYEANTSSNYGCTVNANMAAMIADPVDLIRGRENAQTPDLTTSGRVIGAYRSGTKGK